MTEQRRGLLPIYLAIDESGSMRPVVAELNDGIAKLYRTLLVEPMAAAKVRITVVGFAERAAIHLRLADIREQEGLPKLRAQGNTCYGDVFRVLSGLVLADVRTLRDQGYAVHRPAVFFISDGRPGDPDWPVARDLLTDRDVAPAAPTVVAFGVGAADPAVVMRVATRPEYAFVSVSGADAGTQIASFCAGLTGSIVHTGRMLATGRPELVVERPAGFRLALDLV